MAPLNGKARTSMSWLPNQVAYGIDCSDPDPDRWTAFGQLADDSGKPFAPEAPGFDLTTTVSRGAAPDKA